MKRRAAVWLALLAMTLNASWPLLASANPGTPDRFGTEVCTAHGVIVVVDSDLQLPNPQGPAHRLMPHCAFCTVAPGHSLLHSATMAAWHAPLAAYKAPAEFRPTIVARRTVAALKARAPPA